MCNNKKKKRHNWKQYQNFLYVEMCETCKISRHRKDDDKWQYNFGRVQGVTKSNCFGVTVDKVFKEYLKLTDEEKERFINNINDE